MFTLKPYQNIETAIRAYRNCYNISHGSILIQCSYNFSKDQTRLIDAAILCKVLKTFNVYFNEFRRNYNITIIGHSLWRINSWELRYNSSNFCFEIHLFEPHGRNDTGSQSNLCRCIYNINRLLTGLLLDYKSLPRERYNNIYNQIKSIYEME